jgi:hypothetical protein
MQSNDKHLGSSALKLSRPLAALAAIVASFVAVAACSSALTATSDPACTALSTCCASIGGATGTTCQELQSSAKTSSSASSCETLLQSYEAEGYCGGLDGGGAILDAGSIEASTSSCLVTGTCVDAGTPTAPPTTSCQQIGTCADGETYATCTAIGAGGACAASIVFSGGAQVACVSCTDCAAASASAALQCHPPATGDDAGSTVDSGPSCGTSPSLHVETVPGVYCPFTDAGAVHCTAGEECCEPPAGQASTCQAGGATCPISSSIRWECTDPIDCQGSDAGTVCCATGATSYDSTCGYYRGAGFTGSQCALGCATGQVQLCSAANDPCSSPTQCTPFKVEGLVLGTCL